MMKNVVLETTRTTLKSPVGLIDSDDVIKAINHRETLEYLCSAPYDYTEQTAHVFLGFLNRVEDSNSMLELGIFDKSAGRFIGMISLENMNFEDFSCELGFWLAKDFTGKGIAYEAAVAIIEYAFDSLKMKVINAYTVKENVKSKSLLERLGFRQKELLMKNEMNKGILVDRYWYVLEN